MKENLGLFLDKVWKTGGKVYLAYKKTANDFDVPPGIMYPEGRDKVLNFILTASAQGKDVYFAPAIYKAEASSKHTTNVSHSHVLWCDLDGNAAEVAAQTATGDLPEPSCRIVTGREGHEHWYWFLKESVSIEVLETLNRRIAKYVGADHCWNANRVLRPPFTTNHKFEDNVGAVDIHTITDIEYIPEDFDLLPQVSDLKSETLEDISINMDSLPSLLDVLAKYKWTAQHTDLFKNPPDRVQGTHVRNRSLFLLANLCAEAGMSNEASYVVLEDFDTRIGKFVGRSDRNRRLAELIAKARQKHPFPNVIITETKEDIQQIYTLNEMLHAEFKLNWLVENLLAHRTINSVMGLPNTGKSRFAMQMAKCLAAGSDFLNWNIERPFKVMFFSLEMDRYMLKHFVESLANGKDFAVSTSDNLLLLPLGAPLPLENPESVNLLDTFLSEHKPEIVFIDALGSLTPDKLEEKQSKAIMNSLMALTDKHNVTFVLVHHSRKPEKSREKEEPSLNDMYGSMYVSGYMSTVLALWAPEGQSNVKLIEAKTRGRKQEYPRTLDGNRGFEFILKEETESDDTDDKAFGMFGAFGNL